MENVQNIRPFFINSNIYLDELTSFTNAYDVLVPLGGNTGNSYITYSIIKTIFGGLKPVNHIQNIYTYNFENRQKDIDCINNECTHVFLILQDQIRENESYGNLLPYENIINFIKELNKPVIVAGLGSNFFEPYRSDLYKKLSKDLVKFLKELSSYTETLGIRGHYTEEILSNLGISNTRVIGCPSFFERGANRITEKKHINNIDDLKVLLSCNVNHSDNFKFPKVLQDLGESIYIDSLISNKLSSNMNEKELDNMLKNYYKIFINMDEWKNYVKDFDFTIGYRLHGSILSINAGVAAVCCSGDTRSEEMCNFLNIPRYSLGNPDEKFIDIYESVDYDKLNKEYPKLYNNYIEFLKGNNITPLQPNKNENYIKQPSLNLTNRNFDTISTIDKNLLEIILVTYNRKDKLEKTLNQLFANNSPVKELPLTILNNNSNDGTAELIEKYAEKHPNIKHINHKRNIGGNANIARAFEIASKKYVWVLCDDDEYNWDGWDEVEQAILNDYDAILVANYINPKKNKAQLLKQLTFVPAAIYKTDVITDTVMQNAEFCINYLFPHLAIACNLFNENKNIYICEKPAVKMILDEENASYTRGCSGNIHPYMKEMFWSVGYLNAIQMISNENLKDEIIRGMDFEGEKNLFNCLHRDFWINRKLFHNSKKNISDIECGLSKNHLKSFYRARLKFLIKAKKRKLKDKITGLFNKKVKI